MQPGKTEAEIEDVAGAILGWARRTPDRPAVTDGETVWTYASLAERARRVEAGLREQGVHPGDIVAVQCGRRPEAVAMLLGVLLSDAAYLALETWTPQRRIARALAAAAPRAIIADQPPPFALDGPSRLSPERLLSHEPAAGSDRVPQPRDRAGYVVFTSGSTGAPKGVLVSRRSMAWHAESVGRIYGLRSDDRVLQAAGLDFDVAAEELWPTLCAGGCVHLLPDGMGKTGYAELARLVARQRVTVCNLPSSYFAGWAAELERQNADLGALRLVVVGSEELPADTARRWCARGDRPTLIHAYGVSEATITSIAYQVPPGASIGDRLPIGVPLPGVLTAVRGADDAPVEPGLPGRLLIGGPGVALGYLGAEPADHARFLDGRTVGLGPGRWYRTGDLVRLDGAGLLQHLGREDEQIKVGAVRIEPGEVAAALRAQTGAEDARVFKIGERLAGVVRTTRPIERDRVLARLAAVLPKAAIPDELIALDRFPCTQGGKVDLRALREVVHARCAASADRGEPADPRELLRRLWQELLGAAEVPPDADFFELGGDSLVASRLSAALRRESGISCRLSTIFAHPRFDDLIEQLRPQAVGMERS